MGFARRGFGIDERSGPRAADGPGIARSFTAEHGSSPSEFAAVVRAAIFAAEYGSSAIEPVGWALDGPVVRCAAIGAAGVVAAWRSLFGAFA